MSNMTEPAVQHAEHDEETVTHSLPDNVTVLRNVEQRQHIRMIEALLFAAAEPLDEKTIADRLPEGANIPALIEELQEFYANRGVNLVRIGGRWSFRTADDLAFMMQRDAVEQKRLSRAALETLAIIAYHQPVTRAEIEEIRGVSTSKGTLDALMEIGWIKMRGRRKTPGRPVTYGTTPEFMNHFGLDSVRDLPGMTELKGTGMLDSNMPANFVIPQPHDSDELTDDEDPLEDGDGIEEPLEMHVPEEGLALDETNS